MALELIGFWKSENGRLNLLLSYSFTVHLNVVIFLERFELKRGEKQRRNALRDDAHKKKEI